MKRSVPAVLALAATTLLAACVSDASGPDGTEGSPGWEQAAGTPLSARTDPLLAWTGEEVLVIGGNTGSVCPPSAGCTMPGAVDGAAWDPATGEWRQIAELPRPLDSSWSFAPTDMAVLDGQVVLRDWSRRAWLRYDVAADQWSAVEAPGAGFGDLSQDDGTRIWGIRRKQVVSWDPVSGDVRVEKAYDVSPRLHARRLVLTDAGPVVTGVHYDEPEPDAPVPVLADLPEGDGWRRVKTGQIGWFYQDVAGMVVGAEVGGADSGEHWSPAGGMLDPTTGEWQPLDVPDLTDRPGWSVGVYADEVLVSNGSYRDLAHGGDWVRIGHPASSLDGSLTSVWAGDRLFVWGGIDDADGDGFAEPGGPEAWTWAPPA